MKAHPRYLRLSKINIAHFYREHLCGSCLLSLYKPLGTTPLRRGACCDRILHEPHRATSDGGGLLVVLTEKIGIAQKNFNSLIRRTVMFVLGFSSDTGDVLEWSINNRS
jgi:hypothetical protein